MDEGFQLMLKWFVNHLERPAIFIWQLCKFPDTSDFVQLCLR